MKNEPRSEIGLSDLEPLTKALNACKGETFTYRGILLDRRYAGYLVKWLATLKEVAS